MRYLPVYMLCVLVGCTPLSRPGTYTQSGPGAETSSRPNAETSSGQIADTSSGNQIANAHIPPRPDRVPYAGFEWELLAGAGIMFWAQQSEHIRIGISETLPGAFVERIENGKPVALSVAIQIFDLPDERIEDALATLQNLDTTGELKHCAFVRVDEDPGAHNWPTHARRYRLEPFSEAFDALQREMADGPVTHSCGGWGQANSGIRYFEVQQGRPDKALFIEIGQEAPLFDADGIVLLPE